MTDENRPSIEILEQQYPYEAAKVRAYVAAWNRLSWKYRNKPLQPNPSLEADIEEVKELDYQHHFKNRLSPFVTGELVTGERLFQMMMKEIRKSPEERKKEFEERVAQKVEWLKKYDPHSVEIYLANPY